MLNFRNLFFIVPVALALLVAGCKKDSSTTQSVAGRYRLVYNSGSDSLPQYYVFNDDNTVANLEQTNQYAHTVRRGVYQLGESTIILSFNSPYTYLLKIAGDTVKLLGNTLSAESSYPNVILVKDAAAPTAADWVKEVSITGRVPAVNINLSSFTCRNTMFYTCYNYENRVHRYNTNDGAEQSALVTLADYYGIEAAGGNVWAVADNSDVLDKLDPLSGLVTFTSVAAPNDIHALASDGTKVYGWNINTGTLYIYTIATDSWDAGHRFDSNIREMAFYNGFIYGSNYYNIFKIDPVTLKVVKSYTVKGIDGQSGIAHDGSDFWIYVNDGLSTPGCFARINLD
jgi:hypothetical protein